MTTIRQLLVEAYRENNLINIGRAPTDAELDEALPRLQNYLDQLLGFELGELVYDWTVPPARTSPIPSQFPLKPANTDLPVGVYPHPPANVRLVTKIASATRVYLPARPSDGARVALADAGSTAVLTLDGNGRRIELAASIDVTPADDAPRQWLYRADIASWTRLTDLALDDESPLPKEFDDLIITGVSIRLSPRYGKEPKTITLGIQGEMLRRLRARYDQYVAQPSGFETRMHSRQSYGHSDGDGIF